MLWLLIYRLCSHLKFPKTYTVPDRPVRPDSGKYFPLGIYQTETDDTEKAAIDTSGWMFNGPMCGNGFWWFGLYNFDHSEIESIMERYSPE